ARVFALFFLAFGLGLGLVIWALGHPVVFGNQTEGLDLRMPELSAFYSVLALPHFAWSGVFAAFGVALTLKAIQRGSLTLGLLAGAGLPGAFRRRSREDLFLLAWLVLLAAILYLPNPAGDLRRRFFDGLYLPLAVLAARGMYDEILPRLRSLRARRLIPFSYVAFAATG